MLEEFLSFIHVFIKLCPRCAQKRMVGRYVKCLLLVWNVCFHAKYRLFLSDFDPNSNDCTDIRLTDMLTFMKVFSVILELFLGDRYDGN
jgi:hypothetical protein